MIVTPKVRDQLGHSTGHMSIVNGVIKQVLMQWVSAVNSTIKQVLMKELSWVTFDRGGDYFRILIESRTCLNESHLVMDQFDGLHKCSDLVTIKKNFRIWPIITQAYRSLLNTKSKSKKFDWKHLRIVWAFLLVAVNESIQIAISLIPYTLASQH